MSSTEQGHDVIARYFDEVLVPLAAKMHANGQAPLPLGPDPACASYYVRRPHPAMAPEGFGAFSCKEPGDFERILTDLWKGLGRTDLLAEAHRLGPLAQAARASRAPGAGNAELSPDIYIMF